MPPRELPRTTANRWSPENTARAEVAAAWIEEERRAGRPHGADEVWAFVTGRWDGIGTGDAELVLNVAMTLTDAPEPGPSRQRVEAAILEALRSVCDGTYAGDDPGQWTLEAGPGLGTDMREVFEALASSVHAALQPGHVAADAEAASPAP